MARHPADFVALESFQPTNRGSGVAGTPGHSEVSPVLQPTHRRSHVAGVLATAGVRAFSQPASSRSCLAGLG